MVLDHPLIVKLLWSNTRTTRFSSSSLGNTSCEICNLFGKFTSGPQGWKSIWTNQTYTTWGLNPRANRLTNILGCKVANLPFRYLGLPLCNKHLHRKNWAPVIDCISARIKGGKPNSSPKGADSRSSTRYSPTCRYSTSPFTKRRNGSYSGLNLLENHFSGKAVPASLE